MQLRKIVWVADEWIHRQELAMRQEAGRQEYIAEVDPVASAARERVHKRSARAARPRLPRLQYKAGEWVRQ